ncbi:MAG: enoyl-CoA hydratase/isomerase family protein [Woeseiaceae bacterium]
MIHVERNCRVVFITLDRPQCRNALSFDLLAMLSGALSAVSPANDAAVVISGAGTTFSAGADLSELTGTSRDIAMDDAIADVVKAILEAQVPVIAAVNGPCIGGAVDIMLACDIRVASENALIQVPATRLGLLYNPAAVARMHALLSRDVLTRLLAQGELFDADQAFETGLVTHASPASDAMKARAACRTGCNVGAAVVATERLLDALDNGTYDPKEWERQRREILDSPGRATAIAAAKDNKEGLS